MRVWGAESADNKEGRGKYTFANHDVYVSYEGQWMANRKNGQGTMRYADGTKKVGHWYAGEFVGPAA